MQMLPPVDGIGDDMILTVVGEGESSDSDSDSDFPGPQRSFLKIPTGLRTKGPNARRSFRSEEEVILESQEEGDLETVLTKAASEGHEDLTLNCFKFDQLPELLFNCSSLKRFTAHLNGLTTVQPGITSLVNLTSLKLGQNCLATLPHEIGSLSNLETLDCNRNLLTSIPDSIANLKALKSVNFDYNHLSEIPVCLTLIKGLEGCLLCANEDITDFPQSLDGWKHCRLAVNNSPILKKKWTEMESSFPNVLLMWNKLYPDQVLDHLYLGSVRTAQSDKVFSELSITRIVTAGKQLEIIDPLPVGVDQLSLNVEDIPEQGMTAVFDQVINYIESARKANEKVLVHCFAGLSRSVTFVCAYLIKIYGMTFKDAITYVKERRPNANPNTGFRKQLIAYEQEVHGTRIDPNDKECDMNSTGEEELTPL